MDPQSWELPWRTSKSQMFFLKEAYSFDTRPQGRGLGHLSVKPCKVSLPRELFRGMARVQESPKVFMSLLFDLAMDVSR